MHFCSTLCAIVLLRRQKTGRKEKESEKQDNKKAKKSKLKEKEGAAGRRTEAA